MKNTTLKRINNVRKKTKKKLDKNYKLYNSLTEEQKEIICKRVATGYTNFEDKIEQVFKDNHLDITSTSFNLEKEVIKELKKAVSPSQYTPNNDYYSYINERWLNDLDIEAYQEYITQIDNFRLVQDKVYRELIEIIENYLKNPATKNTPLAKCMKNAYESYKTYNTDSQTRIISKKIVEYIDKLRATRENIWEKLALINNNEIISWGAPFVWSINPDDKNPKVYICNLEPPQLTLIDLDIYIDDDKDTEEDKKYKTRYRKKYMEYLNKLFVVAFGEDHGFNIRDIYDTEVQIFNAMACYIIKDEDEDGYNLVTKDEALKNFGFNWEVFCKHLGFEKVPNEFVTSNVNYLLCGTKLLLENWDSEKWRTYWIYLFIRQQTRWNKEGAKVFYEFQGNFLRGQERDIDEYIRPIFGMSFSFNTFLTNEYITHYENKQAIEYVKSMVEDLRTVFVRNIKRTTWMQTKTKVKAIEKLESIKLLVGSPKILREDPLLDYKENDPWGNLVKIALWRHKKAVHLVGKDIVDIPVIDWSQSPPKMISSQAYVVNAMYTPTENSIYIPLGYIQKPFVDLEERGIEYNLAHIGFTIAHEMSHALDDWGSNYDKDGKLNKWWTEKDSKKFKEIQQDIVKQYEEMALRDGIKFDAWPSIGEDLADISGFGICQEYLRDFQLKNQDILPIQSLSFEKFYVYFALQSRQKISKKAILAQLKTNPHPLDKFRCNVPLTRTRIFSAIYNVKKGDGMWWHNFNLVWSD